MSKKPLPRIHYPLFDLPFPSRDKTVKCRPFLVHEEKILLTAMESGEENDILTALKQILINCIQDDDFDCNDLTLFDLEYMFLKLRSRSVNNVIEVSYRDNDDNQVYNFTIDLEQVILANSTNIDKKIPLSGDIGITVVPPSVSVVTKTPADATPQQLVEYLVRSCITGVYDQDDLYLTAEYTPDELNEFLDGLSSNDFEKINNWFEKLPRLYHKLEYENKNGDKRKIELESLNDFFTWR